MSVALCTFQGERYIAQQLESIAAQTYRPDEVVICDDCSTDQTVRLIQKFQEEAPLCVKLTLNDRRLGVAKNFEKSIQLCEGEVIFCADQDDVWYPEKLAKLVATLNAAPSAGFVFCDAALVDESLRPLGGTLWESLGFTEAAQRQFVDGGAFRYMLRESIAAGMTMGFRSSFKGLVLPIPLGWGHDHFIPLLIASVAEPALVPECLVNWRQHGAQQTGINRIRLDGRVQAARNDAHDHGLKVQMWVQAYERLLESKASYAVSTEVLDQFEAKVLHVRDRVQIQLGVRKWRLFFKEAVSGNYFRYSRGCWSMARDVLLRSLP